MKLFTQDKETINAKFVAKLLLDLNTWLHTWKLIQVKRNMCVIYVILNLLQRGVWNVINYGSTTNKQYEHYYCKYRKYFLSRLVILLWSVSNFIFLLKFDILIYYFNRAIAGATLLHFQSPFSQGLHGYIVYMVNENPGRYFFASLFLCLLLTAITLIVSSGFRTTPYFTNDLLIQMTPQFKFCLKYAPIVV